MSHAFHTNIYTLCKKAFDTLGYSMCIGTLYTCYTQCIAYNECITSQYTCHTLVYNKPFYMVLSKKEFATTRTK